MKVYIQSNKYQRFAAKISAYSFERFGIKTQLLDFDDNEILRKYIGQKYLRNGNLRTYKDDLQSFTLLRFLAPEINSSNEIILVIDPDVFALKNPYEMTNLIDNYDIACTFKNDLPRSEVMLINNKNIKWEFEEICRMLFSKEIDYIDLINLNFDKKLKIKKISNNFNSIDCIDNNTILLHTSNRITQPWKEGLKINFERHNLGLFQKLKLHLKKIIGLNYNTSELSNKFLKHPNNEVYNAVKLLFVEAIEEKFVSSEEIRETIKKGYISEKIIKH